MSRFNVNVTSKTEALNAYFNQAFDQVTNTSIPNQQTAEENEATVLDFFDRGWLTEEEAVSIYGRNISQGGTGSMSPGGFAASGGSENTATLDDVVSLNQMDPVTDDYSINVVAPQTEEQVNRAIASSRTFGMLNPTVTNLEGFDSGAAPETPVLPDTPTVADEPTVPELEEMPPFVLLPALGQNQPPERQEPSGPFVEPSPVNLPPVFTEEDARRLLQSSGQLPFAGIV